MSITNTFMSELFLSKTLDHLKEEQELNACPPPRRPRIDFCAFIGKTSFPLMYFFERKDVFLLLN